MPTATTYPQNIAVLATSPLEAGRKAAFLATIAKNLSVDTLRIIAGKSAQPGIDAKVAQFQNFL